MSYRIEELHYKYCYFLHLISLHLNQDTYISPLSCHLSVYCLLYLSIPAIDRRRPILRLAQLASSLTMGGGPDSKPEHLLVIMPFKEPTEIFDRIRKNHPNVKITFKGLGFTSTPWMGEEEIPKGSIGFSPRNQPPPPPPPLNC